MKLITNQQIANILKEISFLLEMEEDSSFRSRAYEKAALIIESLDQSLIDIYNSGGLKAIEKIPGIGKSLALKIEELIKTGKLKYFEDLKKQTPINLDELTKIEGLGPKSIKKLYQKLKIKNLDDLEKAAYRGQIRKLEGFGQKSEEKILKAIEFAKKNKGRFILGFIMPLVKQIEANLKNLPEIKNVDVCGSIRRRKETIGDIDILVSLKNENNQKDIKKVMSFFTTMPEVEYVYAKGDTKSSIRLSIGIDVDLRIIPQKSYGAALNYFTGSKDHNIALRQIALKKGYKLNEYGLFDKNGRQVAGNTEKELYEFLGLQYIPPEMRENVGEIDLALKNKIPKLIDYNEIYGDLQVQTNWTDGSASIEEMANAALKLGLRYIAITDHTKHLAMTGGLDDKKIEKQWQEIDKLNLKFKNQGFKILKGTECDILLDGSLDLKDKTLQKLDIVGVSIHSHFNLPKIEQTKRIIKAITNPYVNILFHPTCRILQKRESIQADWDEIIKTAKKYNVVLEIDAFPDRLDLNSDLIRKCVNEGVKMSVDSDAHSTNHFSFLEYGISEARRGWARKEDIINAWPLEKMLSFLKKN
ncbi:MAG: DNA polymerase/3'-5' exonuclease PolX [Patescibacteria group bacterium]|nr:DNA polymerase/3'-5' exonuclease PolX [Patescibacteria group bacterium]